MNARLGAPGALLHGRVMPLGTYRLRSAGSRFANGARMRVAPACFALLVTGALGGCATWTHAPGREFAAVETREIFAVESLQLCTRGTCTLRGPGGEVRFSEVSTSGLGNARQSTAFDIDYQNWKGLCRGPHDGADGRGPRPLECTMMERATGESATLVVGDGCTSAKLVYPSGRRLELRTDTVDVLGHRAPAREVALLENGAVVVFSDNTGAQIAFHRAPKAPLPTEQALAILAMHSFAEMEGRPPECIVSAAAARSTASR